MTDLARAHNAGHGLRSLDHMDARLTSGNRVYSFGALAIDAAPENVETTAAVVYCIDGIMYSKAAVAALDISTLDVIDEQGNAAAMTAQADNTDRAYLFALDKDGNVHVIQGQAVAAGANCYCPGCPEHHVGFAVVKVENASGADFIFGTTSLAAAGITDTYLNLSTSPANPL